MNARAGAREGGLSNDARSSDSVSGRQILIEHAPDHFWARRNIRLAGIIRPEFDSLRFYYLGANWERKVEHVGAKPALDLNGPLVL